MVLFTKVAAPPTIVPQSAYWHFGWHVPDVRKSLAAYQGRPEVKLLPLYTTDEGGFVFVSSDTWPGTGGVLGLTKAQIAAAKAEGVKPAGGAGFAYMQGPDNAIVEYQGDMPAERFNHVHLYQEDPFCAQLWYQKHLGGTPVASRVPGAAGAHRGELQGRAQPRPHLAGAGTAGDVPGADRGGHLRRRRAHLVREPR